MRSMLRRTVLSATLLALAALTAPNANAGADDAVAAAVSNAQDIANSQTAWVSSVYNNLPTVVDVDPGTFGEGGGTPPSVDVLPGGSSRTESCRVDAGGRDLVQRTNYAVGEVYGQDMGTGVGECADLQLGSYSCTVTVRIEYFVKSGTLAGTWQPVTGQASATANSVRGACVPGTPPLVTGTYAGGSPFLNHYHRAHAWLTTSRGTRVDSYSPLWFMAP